MGFFDQAFGMPPGGGASAFTSPGMNPSSLAALMAMGGGGMGAPGAGALPGGPMVPRAPTPMGVNAPPNGPAPGPAQSSMAQMLQAMGQMHGNPFGAGGLSGLFGGGGPNLTNTGGTWYGQIPSSFIMPGSV